MDTSEDGREWTDQKLVAHWKANPSDEMPLNELRKRYQWRLQLDCEHRHGSYNNAEDHTQETWIRVWKNIGTFNYQTFEGWIRTIAKRVCIDAYRSKKNLPPDSQNVEDVPDPRNSYGLDENPRTLALRDCLQLLNPKVRRMLQQLYFEGKATSEVAKEFDVLVNTVYKMTSMARKKLKDCVTEKLRQQGI